MAMFHFVSCFSERRQGRVTHRDQLGEGQVGFEFIPLPIEKRKKNKKNCRNRAGCSDLDSRYGVTIGLSG